jgi:hypothetical protein
MAISKHEAEHALQQIDSAQQRAESMQRYRANAPHFLMWGAIWLIANCITEIRPLWAVPTWRVLVIAGSVASIWLTICSVRQQTMRRRGWQVGAAWLAIMLFFTASFAVLPHLDAKQGNAYISLVWGFLYALMGIWSGSRVLIVGMLTTASILVGYFMITTHYFLWMGLVTGGLLMLGGLWLRKV